jgi:hypothetical protein
MPSPLSPSAKKERKKERKSHTITLQFVKSGFYGGGDSFLPHPSFFSQTS